MQDYAPVQPGRAGGPWGGDAGSDASLIHYDGQGVYSMNVGTAARGPLPSQVRPSLLQTCFTCMHASRTMAVDVFSGLFRFY